ncbi:hypothetical protein LN042_28815 [Kitasatospora sp. RB6PN24]|uniref:hypothetical protein n=1 Tax=Kitasatospora humi TaxID=2893891 RepID=UPI001E478EBA|nr:hypothetical protein [Kitasatospora humi]MCC9311023.1 hypothetical protein [Kitasatospora humi]
MALALLPEERDDPVIAGQWRAWWERVPASPTHESRIALDLDGPLGTVIHRNSTTLLAWSSARKRDLAQLSRPTAGHRRPLLADAIRDHSRRTGFRVAEFHLTVTAIPAGVAWFQPIDGDVIAASIELIRDRSAHTAAIVDHLGRRQG